MKYIDEFLTKYGFSDGGETPPDAVLQRDVCIHFLNKAAEALKSPIRAYPYDRPGFHNSLLILFTDGPLAADGLPTNATINTPVDHHTFDVRRIIDLACRAEEHCGMGHVEVTVNFVDGWKDDVAQAIDEAFKDPEYQ